MEAALMGIALAVGGVLIFRFGVKAFHAEKEAEELRTATRQLGRAFREALLPLVEWLDRQLRRWPWLYRKLDR